MRPLSRHPALLLPALLAGGIAATARGAVDFNREVRPILSDKCFHCHGPDESTRKAKLRLDTREGALRIREGIAAIVPGKVAESELLQRIVSPHEDEVMPPPESKLGRLSAEQAAVLRRWIEEGAEYRAYWSFEKLAPVPVPVATGATPRAIPSTRLFSAPWPRAKSPRNPRPIARHCCAACRSTSPACRPTPRPPSRSSPTRVPTPTSARWTRS